MDRATREQLIERYRSGPDALEQALREAGEAGLDRSREGWTPRQVIHHLADSEMTSVIRLGRLLAEDRPQVAPYDQELCARRLHYSERPLEGCLEAIRGVRASTVFLLELLSEQEWAREGTHTVSGRYSVTDWLCIYAAHCHDHAEQIRRAGRV